MCKYLKSIFNFYYTGFTHMTVGRGLWIMIIIKLFIIFVILKMFFFPDTLAKQSRERHCTPAEAVRRNILEQSNDIN